LIEVVSYLHVEETEQSVHCHCRFLSFTNLIHCHNQLVRPKICGLLNF
jgi:hypothetical protein